MGQEERRKIADRTRRALAAYKARGGVLGAHRSSAKPLSQAARDKGAAVVKAKAIRFYGDTAPLIRDKRAKGETLQAIADGLNQQGKTTSAGLPWTATSVSRVLARS